MLMFIIGFIVAWFAFGLFFYLRDSKGGWSIWDTEWDTIVIMLPAFPVALLIEIIEEKIK